MVGRCECVGTALRTVGRSSGSRTIRHPPHARGARPPPARRSTEPPERHCGARTRGAAPRVHARGRTRANARASHPRRATGGERCCRRSRHANARDSVNAPPLSRRYAQTQRRRRAHTYDDPRRAQRARAHATRAHGTNGERRRRVPKRGAAQRSARATAPSALAPRASPPLVAGLLRARALPEPEEHWLRRRRAAPARPRPRSPLQAPRATIAHHARRAPRKTPRRRIHGVHAPAASTHEPRRRPSRTRAKHRIIAYTTHSTTTTGGYPKPAQARGIPSEPPATTPTPSSRCRGAHTRTAHFVRFRPRPDPFVG